jgi:hypothetical protein
MKILPREKFLVHHKAFGQKMIVKTADANVNMIGDGDNMKTT